MLRVGLSIAGLGGLFIASDTRTGLQRAYLAIQSCPRCDDVLGMDCSACGDTVESAKAGCLH